MTHTFAPSPVIASRGVAPEGISRADVRSPHEAASTRLFEIEKTARGLWTVEPDCDAADRTLLMMRLTAVARRIEHLVLGLQFRSDEPIDQDELGRCEKHLDSLVARWKLRRPDAALVA